MNRICVALSAALVLSGISAGAQGSGSAVKSFQLSKVVLDTETVEPKARVKGGTLCVFPSTVKIPKEKDTLSYERFDNLFSDRLKASGLNVVNTSTDLFATDQDKNKADYLIGAIVRIHAINLCSSVKGEKGDASVKIEWQIYDRAAGKVVDTITTDGHGVQDKFVTKGLNQIVDHAFADSLQALLNGDAVRKYATMSSTSGH
jgi:hypothetical protein